MKIGIITELSLATSNYGNHLQSYALNHYLNTRYENVDAETIIEQKKEYKYVSHRWRVYWALKWCRDVLREMFSKKSQSEEEWIQRRKESFQKFANEYIKINVQDGTWKEINVTDYDAYIVGSDVVWSQQYGRVDRIKFLDFPGTRGKRISYAASFENNEIPEANKVAIGTYLKRMNNISVREKRSLSLIEGLGIRNAIQTCDPVFLLNAEEWEKIEIPPTEMDDLNEEDRESLKSGNYIFAYLFEWSGENSARIEEYRRRHNKKLVSIPYLYGRSDNSECHGDIDIVKCGPREWVWLINHCDSFITDSFHGIAFSVIFEKSCTVMQRQQLGKNDRLADILDTLGIEGSGSDTICELTLGGSKISGKQNFDKNNLKLDILREQSIEYIEYSLFGK